ncbi:TcdA/TcdB catalytic glycosyltransferase domain-containing protein [Enterobacteriaceae bacterium C34A]
MKIKFDEVQSFANEKTAVPDIIHFVWIGDSRQINYDYIDIWLKANKNKRVYLWLDKRSYINKYFHDSIREYALSQRVEDYSALEMNIKNIAFSSLFSKIKEGRPFDNLVKTFLSDHYIQKRQPPRRVSDPRISSRNIVVMDIAELFTADFHDFMKYYYYEIMLRDNLASASDIVRLLILYLHGGVYVDMDTLPYMDDAFRGTNRFLQRNDMAEDDYWLLMKTRSVLDKLADPDNFQCSGNGSVACFYKDKYEKILRLIEKDMAKFTPENIAPLGNIQVHENLLAVASLRRLKGIYFNNFMASHSGSKAVRIILRAMKKRYRYLERKNCIFECYSGGNQGMYLSRILTWRTELMTKNYCVTSALTGPGLILEVLLGLAYQLIDLEGVEPSTVAEYFQDEHYGVALYQHNLDTPDGLYSSWRK